MRPARPICFLLLLAACGPSQAEYDKLAGERTTLSTRVASLEGELDELRNGAPRRLGEIESAFRAGHFEQVVASADQLADRHPGAPETAKAKSLAVRARERVAEATRRKKAEAEAARREAAKSERQKVQDVIRIRRLWTSNPNSAGGVDLRVVWQNRSDKTVKYVSFSVEAYNGVGDPVTCSIRDYSEFSGRVTGPIRPGQWHGEGYSWENAWYNPSIVRGKLTNIRIEYTDGTTAEFAGDQARLALS